MAAVDDVLSPSTRERLQTLRTTLQACAERSGEEKLTASVIATFLTSCDPDRLLTNLGGHGVAAVFCGAGAGPTVMVRADLDAVVAEHSPQQPGGADASHTCGHDGHMSMVAGLAPLLQHARPARGTVVLLFQPAEETGEGAARVIADPRFAEIRPDYALALHNIPGAPLGTIVIRAETFASASVGMRSVLTGVSSHAAEPEKGISPVASLSQFLAQAPALSDLEARPYRLLTVTHARLGHETYGVSPGEAIVCATLRSGSLEGLEQLQTDTEALLRASADAAGVGLEIRWLEAFPAVRNDGRLVEQLREVCAEKAFET